MDGVGETPLISCLMVTRARLFPARFAVEAYRRQTWPNRELVVICDRPEEGFEAWLAALDDRSIRYVSTPPAPLGTLRNVALDAARGPLVCQWDDDDLCHPQRLAIQHGALAAAGADAHFLSHWLMWWPARRRLAVGAQRLWEGTMLARRAVLGRYRPLARGEDSSLLADLNAAGARIAGIDEPLAYCYIVHGGNAFGEDHFEGLFAGASEAVAPDAYDEEIARLDRILPLRAYAAALSAGA